MLSSSSVVLRASVVVQSVVVVLVFEGFRRSILGPWIPERFFGSLWWSSEEAVRLAVGHVVN
jgi:hypothetical protein